MREFSFLLYFRLCKDKHLVSVFLYCIHLRRSAAKDKIFKLFFLHPFLASTIYNNTIKNIFDIG